MESFWLGNSAEREYDTWCHDASVVKVDRRVLELTSNFRRQLTATARLRVDAPAGKEMAEGVHAVIRLAAK